MLFLYVGSAGGLADMDLLEPVYRGPLANEGWQSSPGSYDGLL